MATRGQRLRLGIFVLVTLSALGGLIIFLGGAPRWFQKRNDFTVLFPDAPGVTVGTPIRRSGVRVGEVGAIDLDDRTGLVRVSLRIDPRFTPRSKEDVTISRNLISSDSSIDFVPRDPDKQVDLGEPIPIGAELIGLPPPSPRTLLNQASDVLPDVQLSLDAMRKSVQRFEKIAPRVEEALEAVRDLARSVDEFVPEVRRTNDEIRTFVNATRGLGPEIRKTNDQIRVLLLNASNLTEEVRNTLKVNEPEVMKAVRNFSDTTQKIGQVFNDQNQQQFSEALKTVNSTSKKIETLTTTVDETVLELRKTLDKLTPQLQSVLTQAELTVKELRTAIQPLSQRADRIASNLETGSEAIKGIVTDIREVVRLVARSDGTVQKFLSDPAFYDNLNGILVGVNRLVPRFDRILMDIEVFADKIARHPESIGVGGAVRPSTGLKESPNAPLIRPR